MKLILNLHFLFLFEFLLILGSHHEAMDVDTPPPATRIPAPTFPPDSTATSNPFHFSHTTPIEITEILPDSTKLSFNPDFFDPEEAFGLAEVSMSDAQVEIEEENEEEEETQERSLVYAGRSETKSNGTEHRRRKGIKKDRSPDGRRRNHTNDYDEDGEGGNSSAMGMGLPSSILGGRNPSNSEFSFQVHHHHGSSTDPNIPLVLPERWLNRNTPYVLLG